MVIGVLGGGQLGRMLALAGIPLGLTFRFFDPAPECVAADVGLHTRAAWDDRDALRTFAASVDVVTYEFENVPTDTVAFLAALVKVAPGVAALTHGQDRIAEKDFFVAQGLSVHPYRAASTLEEFHAAVAAIGAPCVAKTRRMGYDGKGQAVVKSAAEVDAAWEMLQHQPLLVEQFVPFESEASIIGVRGSDGAMRTYPMARNVHRGGILRVSTAPADNVGDELATAAERHMRAVLTALDYVGVMAIEFFVSGGRLLANEMAPRVHNSGHWTIEGSLTSQFENHVRAIAGLPLGETAMRAGPCVMVNIIGQRPDAAALLRVPGLHLHDYAKTCKPGRKVAHLTLQPAPMDWEQIPAIATVLG